MRISVCRTARGQRNGNSAHFALPKTFLLWFKPVVYFCHPVIIFWIQKQEKCFVMITLHLHCCSPIYAYIPPWLFWDGNAVATLLSTSESFKRLIYIRAQVFLPSQRAVNCHTRISKIQTKLIQSSTQIPYKRVFKYSKTENVKLVKLIPAQLRRNQKL